MGWYRRIKFIFDTFHTSRIIPITNPIQDSIFVKVKIQQYKNPIKGDIFNSNKVVSPFLRRGYSLNNGFLNQNKVSPFVQNGLKRFYSVDKDEDDQNGYNRWILGIGRFYPKGLLEDIKEIVGVGLRIVVCSFFGKLEIVPFTNRKHFVLSKSLESLFHENEYRKVKKDYKGKILPEIHPDSVRVRLIANEIIESLQKVLKKERGWNNEHLEGMWRSKGDEILDDKWVQQSRKKGEVAATAHLDALKWEVLVVDKPNMDAFAVPGGAIVVYTGMLKHYKSDAEIATIIGHEVAHIVARHDEEKVIAHKITSIETYNRLCVRMEFEADYIGLLLMASAGYDPWTAPRVLEKLGKNTGEYSMTFPGYPSNQQRAQCLTQHKVMEEAQHLYREFLPNVSKKRNEISRKRKRKSFTKK